MKKSNLSVLGMLAMVLVFGFMLAGCVMRDDAGTEGTDQGTGTGAKTIQITGLPPPVSNIMKTVQVDLLSGGLSTPFVYAATGAAVIAGETQVDLYTSLSESASSGNRWTGSGELYIRLRFFDEDASFNFFWKGGKKYPITDTVTKLDFADFSVVFTSVEELTTFLNRASENNADTPISVKMLVDLADGINGWAAIVAALAEKKKYVDLDVTDCAMSSGSEFFPGFSEITGEPYITGLALPNAAKSIYGGEGYFAFMRFENLKTLSAAEVETIEILTFVGCPSLSSVSLPKAESIGHYAFEDCRSLATVSLPAVTSIHYGAFLDCTSLTTVSLPAVMSIDHGAFMNCKSLSSVFLPATPPTVDRIFLDTSGGSGMITITVPSADAVAAYMEVWGVSNETAANGYVGVYGSKHRAVTIAAP
jgi:hypothetical protein